MPLCDTLEGSLDISYNRRTYRVRFVLSSSTQPYQQLREPPSCFYCQNMLIDEADTEPFVNVRIVGVHKFHLGVFEKITADEIKEKTLLTLVQKFLLCNLASCRTHAPILLHRRLGLLVGIAPDNRPPLGSKAKTKRQPRAAGTKR